MTESSSSNADRVVLDAVGVALSALPTHAVVAVGFSGGLDSAVLLDAAARVTGAGRVVALHVHHGLSTHADAWLAHCEAFARERGVAFAARRVDVTDAQRIGVEAAARDARYRALDQLCGEHGAVSLWLAQHADDQAETVLLQLLRGAGLAGLAAMGSDYLAPGTRVPRSRPLLALLRAQLEQYAQGRGLRWVDDESNADTRYARNALRHDVLPTLTVRFPGFRDALARAAAHAAAAQRLVDELAKIDLHDVAVDQTDSADGSDSAHKGAENERRNRADRGDVAGLADPANTANTANTADGANAADRIANPNAQIALRRDALLALDDDRALNLLRYWIRSLGLPAASTARLTDALRQLRELGDDHAMRVDHAGQALRCYRGVVYWEAGDSAEPADETALTPREASELRWQGETVWHLPQWRGSFVFAPAPDDEARDVIPERTLSAAPLVVCSRRGGERMRCEPGGPSRTLKNLFQARGVPAWRRDVPLLYVGERLLFVPGLGVNLDALPTVEWNAGRDAPTSGEPNADRPAAQSAGQADEARTRGLRLRIEWRPDIVLA